MYYIAFLLKIAYNGSPNYLLAFTLSVEMEIKKDAVWSGTKTAYGGDIFPDPACVP